jgi:polyribonucleotide nucleotidyltransferase
MNKNVRKETEFAGKKLVLETGNLAQMSDMSVLAKYGDTVVLVTVVAGAANPDIDFFPLTVVYEEKLYASGSIKTSRFVKRDGKPTDEAVVTKRLIDHAIRPLFPSDYMDEVQVVATILSLDDTSDPEFLSMLATSAALQASRIPWEGPMGSVKVGFFDGDYRVNPTTEELKKKTELEMMISFVGEDRRFLAVEAEAHVLPEDKILGAMEFAREQVAPLMDFVNDFAKEVNPDGSKYTYISKKLDAAMLKDIEDFAKPKVQEMMSQGFDKTKLQEAQDQLMAEMFAKFEGVYKKADMSRAFSDVQKHALQHMILEEEKRPDGRGIKEVRPISTEVGVLPRTHGSALFSRGITQVLTVATLGSPSLEMFIQSMYGEETKRYMHFYNFPPYASGETGKFGAPGGREIGHGMLAEKALKPIIPSQKEFPYTVVLMSETLSSSGSSSMAATCASSMALMDAGVPIKDMVGGVGVGLIVNDDMSKMLIMTDLAYMEDAYGFMDFKMTGTRAGVTAIQADIKAKGIPFSLMPKIIEQSREGRLHVLDEMQKTISSPKDKVSQYAPKTFTTQIPVEKIGLIIGSGGKTIKELQERTGAELAIDEDGTVAASAIDENAARSAIEIVEAMVKEVKAGEVYDGVVKEIVDFGAFVEILPGKQGLLHISEIAQSYVGDAREFLTEGDVVQVKVLEVGRDGKISLSKRALEPGYEPKEERQPRDRNQRGGRGGRDFRRNGRSR